MSPCRVTPPGHPRSGSEPRSRNARCGTPAPRREDAAMLHTELCAGQHGTDPNRGPRSFQSWSLVSPNVPFKLLEKTCFDSQARRFFRAAVSFTPPRLRSTPWYRSSMTLGRVQPHGAVPSPLRGGQFYVRSPRHVPAPPRDLRGRSTPVPTRCPWSNEPHSRFPFDHLPCQAVRPCRINVHKWSPPDGYFQIWRIETLVADCGVGLRRPRASNGKITDLKGGPS